MTYKENIERLIVSKETAVALRQIGFNEWCDKYYHVDEIYEDDPDSYEMGSNQKCNENFEDYHERVAAPYVIDALLWMHYRLDIMFDLNAYRNGGETMQACVIVGKKNGRDKKFSSFAENIQLAIKSCIDEYFKEETDE